MRCGFSAVEAGYLSCEFLFVIVKESSSQYVPSLYLVSENET